MTIRKSLLKHKCDILHIIKSKDGKIVDSTDENVPCRKLVSQKFIKDAIGDHLVFQTIIIFAADADIDQNCEIRFSGIVYPVKTLESPEDRNGNIHHYEAVIT